jgi:hypothetical protein
MLLDMSPVSRIWLRLIVIVLVPMEGVNGGGSACVVWVPVVAKPAEAVDADSLADPEDAGAAGACAADESVATTEGAEAAVSSAPIAGGSLGSEAARSGRVMIT